MPPSLSRETVHFLEFIFEKSPLQENSPCDKFSPGNQPCSGMGKKDPGLPIFECMVCLTGDLRRKNISQQS